MTAVMTKPGQATGDAQEKLRTRVGGLALSVEELTESLATSHLRREKLTAERGPLVLPARAHKDKAAQSRLHAIDEQLGPLKLGIADDEDALAELKIQLSVAEQELESAVWEGERAEIRQVLTAHLERGVSGKVEKAVDALISELKAAIDEDDRIAQSIVNFEPKLRRASSELRRANRARAQIIGWYLKDLLPIDTRGLHGTSMNDKTIAGSDVGFYERALDALNELQLVF